jgi:hypothetical protein
MKKYIIFILLLLNTVTLQAQTDTLRARVKLKQKLSYNQKDYFAFMRKNRNYLGFSCFYDWQNFPNAANKHWMSNMHSIGVDTRFLWYPLMLDGGSRSNSFGKINSTYQIPTFQSAKINEYLSGSFVSLSVFPLPYIPALKRIQEYISPYAGFGYQWDRLYGWAFDSYDSGYYNLNLSSRYWKIGCHIFFSDSVPLDLFIEYVRTINPDKIRSYECVRIGMVFRYSDLFKYLFSGSKKSFSRPLIDLK